MAGMEFRGTTTMVSEKSPPSLQLQRSRAQLDVQGSAGHRLISEFSGSFRGCGITPPHSLLQSSLSQFLGRAGY